MTKNIAALEKLNTISLSFKHQLSYERAVVTGDIMWMSCGYQNHEHQKYNFP